MKRAGELRSILVLRGGALGDFIVTLPALALLRGRWPRARIELVGNRRAAELGVLEGVIDAAHSQHDLRWAALFGRDELPGDLCDWLARFDLVVSWWPDPDGDLARRFPARPGQVYLAGAAKPAMGPAARHFCAALAPLGLDTEDFRSRLTFARCDAPACADGGRRVIAVHPGSSSPARNWSLGNWEALCARLEQGGHELVIVLGEADEAAARALGRFGRSAANLPLPELARLLAGARVFAGHDTGVAHLAAAVGCPSVLLFGPTEPAVWAPLGSHVTVLRKGPSPDALDLGEVEQALLARLGDAR